MANVLKLAIVQSIVTGRIKCSHFSAPPGSCATFVGWSQPADEWLELTCRMTLGSPAGGKRKKQTAEPAETCPS